MLHEYFSAKAGSWAVLRGLGFLLFKVFIVSYGYGGFMVDKSMI
jgi:hypothetical protein